MNSFHLKITMASIVGFFLQKNLLYKNHKSSFHYLNEARRGNVFFSHKSFDVISSKKFIVECCTFRTY